MARFRNFMKNHPVNILMGEEGEAPPPSNPQNTHNDVNQAVSFNMGIDQDVVDDYDQQDALIIAKPFKFFRKWGFNVKGPIPASAKHNEDGTVEVTFNLLQLPKQSFYLPYKDGQTPVAYEGPIENKKEILSKADFQDIKATGLDQLQPGMMAGAQGGMGGGGGMMGM